MAYEAEPTLETAHKLSFGGVLHKSANKQFAETILLVPFFAAKKPQLQRHVDLLGNLGYDCVTYHIKHVSDVFRQSLFSSKNLFGMKHIWADQIESLLNEIPGQKIIFSFSNPSASAIEAIARRRAVDIKGLICDSGPSAELWSSILNYFTYEEPVRTLPLRLAMATLSTLSWKPKFKTALDEDLVCLPPNFRILSIRGWKDKLINPQQIDQVFEPHAHLDWQKFSLPQAGHLNGLKNFPKEYTPAVQSFLESISTRITRR